MRLPYIGGAKGQVLEIRQRPDGSIFSRILMDDVKTDYKKEDFDSNLKGLASPEVTFEDSLASIQRAAAELVNLQQTYKENGRLSDIQKRKYTENLEKLGISAQKLANVQDDDDYKLLFEGHASQPQGDRIKGGSKTKPDNIKFPPYAKKPQAPPKIEECGEEESVGEEGSDSTTSSTAKPPAPTTTTKAPVESSPNESVSVTSSDDDDDSESSVAEAKPGKINAIHWLTLTNSKLH